jgi:hypothetical protein
MASSATSSSSGGFATPAAAAVCLAFGVMASASVVAGVSALSDERRDYQRLETEYALEGAQAQAAVDIWSNQQQGWGHRRSVFGDRSFEVITEPELAKISLARASQLDDADFGRWGVATPELLRARLAQLSVASVQSAHLLGSADGSAAWRLCARSSISPFGAADHLITPTTEPGATASTGHMGQLWRVRLASDDGWVDDRIIRFTGSATHPISVAAHWFGRGGQMGEACARQVPVAPG